MVFKGLNYRMHNEWRPNTDRLFRVARLEAFAKV